MPPPKPVLFSFPLSLNLTFLILFLSNYLFVNKQFYLNIFLGLALAQALRGSGVCVTVYERDASPQARSQGKENRKDFHFLWHFI
jgi:hypothetical protein